MNHDKNRFYGESPNYQNRAYDSRTYYSGEGRGQGNYMPTGRGGYQPGDMETHWDRYNAAHYGSGNYQPDNIGSGPDNRFWKDDYRMHSGNREWYLNNHPTEGHNERFEDRYQHSQRYGHNPEGRHHRDVFEWVGAGVSRAWDGISGHRHDRNEYDRDRDYHRSYRHERDSYNLKNEENMRAYGNRRMRGYERGHEFGDDTPNRQQQIGDRGWAEGNYNESDYHRAGRFFDRERNL